jgi:uncharacterized protein (TIGR00369 family)
LPWQPIVRKALGRFDENHRAKEGQLEELSRAGEQALESQPLSALLEARLAFLSEGEAVLEVPIRSELLQQNGFVHGGVINYLVDNALTFAGGSVLGPAVLTSEYKINYLRPASGETLAVQAAVVHAGGRQAVCHCDVFAFGSAAARSAVTVCTPHSCLGCHSCQAVVFSSFRGPISFCNTCNLSVV